MNKRVRKAGWDRLVRTKLIALTAGASVLTAACAGGSEPETRPLTASPSGRPAGSIQQHAQECVDFTGSPTALITMTDNEFDPDCFTVSSGQGLTIRNRGVSLHNLSVDFRKALTGTDLDVDVSSGEKIDTEAVGETLERGTYRAFCKYHLPTMVAQLKVR